jgi:hypothetical protein
MGEGGCEETEGDVIGEAALLGELDNPVDPVVAVKYEGGTKLVEQVKLGGCSSVVVFGDDCLEDTTESEAEKYTVVGVMIAGVKVGTSPLILLMPLLSEGLVAIGEV